MVQLQLTGKKALPRAETLGQFRMPLNGNQQNARVLGADLSRSTKVYSYLTTLPFHFEF